MTEYYRDESRVLDDLSTIRHVRQENDDGIS